LLEILTNEVAKNSVVLEKGQIPIMKEKKNAAYKKIQEEIFAQAGKKIDIKALAKMICNVKSRIKRKSDVHATGNKPIKLSPSERRIWDLMQVDKNPIFQRLDGKWLY
jgi:hypothetical protein